ncbi:MAG: methyltransferase [Mesorhizobium sp.]|nr:MAG: methyltransferase [Mesorhizobium sp.]
MSANTACDNTSATMALLHMAAGGWIGQSVHVAAKLGIADVLESGPKTPREIATTTGSHPEALHRLLRTLASLGIFAEDEEGRFGLTAIADGLRSQAPVSLRAFAIMLGEEMLWRPWGDLHHAVQTGEAAFAHVFGDGLYDYLEAHPAAAAIFDAAITDRARQENKAVVDAYDWWPETIVDVGGGQGSLLTMILAHAPNARGVLFEMPHVADGAKKMIERTGLGSRCAVVNGDFFQSVPTAGDLYLMRRVVHGWSDESATVILRNCRKAMTHHGRLLIVEHVLAQGNAPSWGKMLDLQQLVLSAGGRERTEKEFAHLLAAAGFKLERVISTSSTASLIEAVPVAEVS